MPPEDVAAWRATYVGLMELYLDREDILTFVQSALKDESPLVRERAVRALSVMLLGQPPLRAVAAHRCPASCSSRAATLPGSGSRVSLDRTGAAETLTHQLLPRA